MLLDGFLNILDQAQNTGMSSTDIFRNVLALQQQNQEDQYNLKVQQAQSLEQLRQQQVAQANQAQVLANQQARIDVSNQINNNRDILDFKNKISDYNVQVLQGNVSALQSAMSRDTDMIGNLAASRSGEAQSSFAERGIIVNTGSARDSNAQVIDNTFAQGKELYTDKINKINSVLAAITNENITKASNALATDNINTQLANKANRI